MLKRAGILAPLFSVYSKKSVGTGDFDDLKLLVDLCVKTGNSILQLLPMNEVGPLFCPYDAISSFALEPLYISLRSVRGSKRKAIESRINKTRDSFPAGRPYADYRVRKEKVGVLRIIYQEEGLEGSRELEKFTEDNAYWLEDFALFNALKIYHDGLAWYDWEGGYRDREPQKLELFKEEHREEVGFQRWVQWIAFRQFAAAKEYAGSKKVLVKGDLPILTSRDSADVWAHQGFFKLDFAAGAPPDMYCAKGQRWGMPTYNWGRIAADGYAYVKEKLRYAENFYDILRIDHVVGLFRIWSIPYDEPMENEGINGFFDPKDENAWGGHGRNLLSTILNNTKMLLCAEDLGIIPRICPDTLKEMGIPGNDVQRWMKDWNRTHDFLAPEDYRAISVAMLSTHDTTNWAAWWENEAGTVDEELFRRKCSERGINYDSVKGRLFDPIKSRHKRLRWLNNIASTDILVDILGKRKEDVSDFIEMYENSYREKEKLWKEMKMRGAMKEKVTIDSIGAALNITLKSKSVFCIQLILDWLMLGDIFKGDPYQYRINMPGKIDDKNWSLTIPLPLEGLLEDKVCNTIKTIIRASGRI